jgi:hypothetical protein
MHPKVPDCFIVPIKFPRGYQKVSKMFPDIPIDVFEMFPIALHFYHILYPNVFSFHLYKLGKQVKTSSLPGSEMPLTFVIN